MGSFSNFRVSKGVTTTSVSNLIGVNITDDSTVSNTDISFVNNDLIISNKSATGNLILKTNNTTALTISASGTITGSFAATSLTGTIPTARLGAGVADSTTYLRGDNTWQTVTSGATITNDNTTNATRYILFDDVTTGAATTVGVSSSKLFFNPSTGQLNATKFVGDGSGLTGLGALTAYSENTQIATAGQTTFSLTYEVGRLQVFKNGIKLISSDFTATNGTSVVLTSAAAVGDELVFVIYSTISLSGALVPADIGGTVQAKLTSGANIKSINGATILGSGDLTLQPTLVSGTNIKSINSTSLLGSGDISVGNSINALNYFLSSF